MKKRVFAKILIIYLSTVVCMFLINMKCEKADISMLTQYSSIRAFGEILLKNSVSLIWIISGLVVGSFMVYSYIFANGIILGTLISKFKNMSYLILILPHGVLEIFVFMMACTIVKVANDQRKIDNKIKKEFWGIYLVLILAAYIEAFVTPELVSYIQ